MRGGIYSVSAEIYDFINEKEAGKFIQIILEKNKSLGINFNSCVEFGCGTGLILKEFSLICDHVAGCDIADEMLEQARRRLGDVVQLEHEDARNFTSDRQCELALCVNECINYLPDLTSWKELVVNARRSLVHGGTLILGYDTIYDLSNVWEDNINIYEHTDYYCIKTYKYDNIYRAGNEKQVYFIKNGSYWQKIVEEHRLYSFGQSEIITMCTDSGFKLLATQDGDTGSDFVPGASLRCVLYLEKV